MAVNETIITGRKFRELVDKTTSLWNRYSFWNKASDTEFDDGNDAETKLGAINGITDSLTATDSNIAASAKALNEVYNSIVNNNLTMRYDTETDSIQLLVDGEWISWKIAGMQKRYLYCEGALYEDITGGWGGTGWNIGTYNTSNAIYNEYNVEFTDAGGSVRHHATKTMIDLTEYKKLCFSIKTTVGSNGIFYNYGKETTFGDLSNLPKTSSVTSDYVTYELDISSVSGNYYVYAFTYGDSGAGYIDKIWLE